MTSGSPTPSSAGATAASFIVGNVLVDTVSRSKSASAIARRLAPAAAFAASPRYRAMLLANAAAAAPPDTPERARLELARAMTRSHFDFVIEMARHARGGRRSMLDRLADVTGREHFEHARARATGVVLVTAHLGSFEVGAAALAAIEPNVSVVFKRDPFPAFERCRERVRREVRVREIAIDDGLKAWLDLRDALNAGGVALMQADLAIPGQATAEARVLGRRARLPTGPYRIAAMTGSAVLPVYAPKRPDGKVDVNIEPAIYPSDPHDVTHAVTAVAESLTGAIRRHPEQWILPRDLFIDDQA